MDQSASFQGPDPERPGYGSPAVNPARFAIHADDHPVTLTFEAWRTEYVVPAGEWVEVEFDMWVSTYLPSLVHHENGIIFICVGAHPTVRKDGQLMPVTKARTPIPFGPPEDPAP